MEKLRLLPILFFILFTGCQTDSHEVSDISSKFKFDQGVIDRIPLYDSLATAILEQLSFFQHQIDQKSSYHAYKYIPGSDQNDVFKVLPKEITPKIEMQYNKIGKDFIYGFDVFKDSTIKIRVRYSLSENLPVDIDENISYFPTTIHMQHRELPIRDTMLNTHWQYWVRFNRHGLIRGL